jgi:hypothetical protein
MGRVFTTGVYRKTAGSNFNFTVARGSVALGTAHTHMSYRASHQVGEGVVGEGGHIRRMGKDVVGEREYGGEGAVSNGIPLHMAAIK